MKLYYWLKDWQLPGQQHKAASRVEIPTDAAGLCAWLNERRVPICLPLNEPLYHGSGVQLADEAEPQLADDLRRDCAEIPLEPHNWRTRPRVPGFCDACGRSAAGTLKLAQGAELDQVLAWADTAELWQLERVAEGIRDHVKALGDQLAERSVQ